MPINILMPALSPTMEKGNLAKWLKKEGDAVKSGDVIAEIETDKATMEVEAIDEGVLAKIVVPEGTADVPVNQLIALIAGEGEDPRSFETPAAPAPQDEGPKKAPPTSPHPEEARRAVSKDEGGSQAAQPAPATAPQPAAKPNGGARGQRVFASPLARRIAKDAGIEIAMIQGSGPHGRVIERDVRAAMAGGGAKAAPAAAAAPVQPAAAKPPTPALAPAPSDAQVKALFEPGSYEEIPHDSMRKTIARRLTEARQTVPQFYLTMDCEIDALLKLREQVNAAAPKDKDGKPAWKVSVNDMAIKALAVALMRVPDANVTWTEGAMLRHKHADVGVAVALPGNGLITPIIRAAETKTLSVIANQMKDYAARAKNRKLKPEEYQGGTTAVSNLGMFGIKDFTAVINPPHSTILAVGGGEQRPVVKGGQLAVATVMSATLSCDHRAVDGALGAQLINAFKELIENPMGMLV
jgi:pyruvate dehydrogenase E2 component (dihydrolipoamide acetyltransferase)